MTDEATPTKTPVAALLVLLIAALVLVPLGGGLLMIQSSQRALERSVEQGQLATARSIASEVSQSLNNATALIRAAARRNGLVESARTRNANRLSEITGNIRATNDAVTGIVVRSLDGRSLVEEPSGLALEGEMGTDFQVFPARAVGNDARLVVRAPIRSTDNDRPVAVIFGEVSMRKAAPSVTRTRFGRTGSATIVQRSGHVVLAGDPKRPSGATPAPAITRATADGVERTVRYFSVLLNREEVASSARVEGQPWMVLVSQSTEEAFAQVARLRASLIAVVVVTIAGGGFLAMWSVRTLRAHERRLRAQLAEQARLNTALDQFASRAAHDLRNPLATIRMAVDMLNRDPLNEMQQTASTIIERQSIRALDLIEGLLTLAKATGTPRLSVVELRPLVERVAENTAVRATVVTDGPVVADPVGLQQVVANLMENAARYAKANGDGAEVTVSRVEQNDGWVVSVADRGPGVPASEVSRIFRAFERGANASGVGTGLGLAIVGAVADAHGGRAWYEPREGGGSVFNVFIPRPPDYPSQPRNGDH